MPAVRPALSSAALLASLAFTGVAYAGGPPVVAVFEIEDTGGARALKKELVASLGDYLDGQLAEGGVYQVVPREALRAQLAQAKRESTRACFDDACQIEIGKAVAAEKTLSTRLIRIGEVCILKSSLFDLRREVSEHVANTKTGCKEDDLIAAVEEVAAKLKRRDAGAPKVEEKPAAPPKVEEKPAAPPKVEEKPAVPPKVEERAESAAAGPRAWPVPAVTVSCDAERCLSDAYKYRDGTGGVNASPTIAFAYFLEACKLGKGAGCTDVGYMFANGKGVAKELERGPEFYQRGCDLGNLVGCANLGFCYQNGQGVANDDAKALFYFRKACDGGEGRGCTDYGWMAENGRGMAKNPELAAAYYQLGCDKGNMVGCANSGFMHQHGRGVGQNDATAVMFYRKACDGGEGRGCTDLGWMYENGRGVPASLETATQNYRKGCEGGNAVGCANLGYMLENGRGTPVDVGQARQFYQKGCDGGNQRGCDAAVRLR
jgi:TPR repeat protein